MANSKKASHHHGKAGECLSKGDHKGAAHHMGHALAALRGAASDGDDFEAVTETPEASDGPKLGIRDRLKRFGTKK